MTPEGPIEDQETVQSPVAPVSAKIDAYYKGFHLRITQRDPNKQDETFLLMKNAKQNIDLLIKEGWTPGKDIEESEQHK